MLKKKIIPFLIIIALVIGISGCNLVKVDPQKDMQTTIAKTKEGKIEKKEFINYFTYYEMVYKLNGYPMPKGEELTKLKDDLVNSMVEINILKQEAVNKKYKVDTSKLDEEVKDTTASLIGGFENEEAYTAFIKERNLTKEEYEAYLKQYFKDVKYANSFIENYSKELQKSGKEAKKTVVTVDKEKLLKDEFYYQLSQMELFYYANYGKGLPTDEESVNKLYGQFQDTMAQSTLVRKDGKAQKITLKDEDVKAKQDEIKSQYTALVGENTSDYLANYYLTAERFEELVKLDAQTKLYEAAMSEKFKKDTSVTDKEIKDYYETNKASYDTSTVSAKHILTKDEEFAKQISAEVTDAASFEAAFEKYKENEKVSEAADLGAFKFAAMVPEFATEAFNLEKGAVSKPIKSEYGYHIIYVYDKNPVEVPTLVDKTEEIKNTLMAQKLSKKITDYKKKLASKAKIKKEEIKDPVEAYVEKLKEEYKVKTYPKRLD